MTDVPPAGVPVAPLDRESYSSAQIAARWGCSAEVVRFLIHSGQLDGFRIGRRLLRVRADKLVEHEIRRGSSPGQLGPRVPREPTELEIRRKEVMNMLRFVRRRQEAREGDQS